MRILMLGWELPPKITGGLGIACHGLLSGFHAIGNTEILFAIPRLSGGENDQFAKLIAIDTFGAAPNECKNDAVSANYDDAYSSHLMADAIRFANGVKGLLEELGQIDVIHAHDWMTFPAAVEVKRRIGRPLIAHVHSTEMDRSGSTINKGIFRVEKSGLAAADKVVAVSNFTKEILINRYAIDKGKIATIYNAIDNKMAMSQGEKFGKDEIIVSFIGRITHQKGPRYFIEAAHKVAQQIKNVRFVMAGTGDQLPMIKALISNSPISELFEFPGFLSRDSVRRLLEKTHVFVMPSVSEPFGIVALEAIFAGVPVVLSRHAGVAEVINSAIKVDPTETGEIANAIVSILRDSALSKALTESALNEAKKLRWEGAATALIDIYRSVIREDLRNQTSIVTLK